MAVAGWLLFVVVAAYLLLSNSTFWIYVAGLTKGRALASVPTRLTLR